MGVVGLDIISKRGYVIEVFIEESFRFIHTSDVEGLTQEEQSSFIIENQPNMIILDGPLSYIPNFLKEETLEKSLNNIINVIYKCPLEILILDHHFLRDLEWRKIAEKIFNIAEELNVKVQTAAQYMKLPLEMLEANRKKLYEEFYNQPALFNLGKGFIENEKPLITIETLKKLYEKFGKLIIYSERPRKQAIYVLEKFKLKDYFNLNASYFREEINKFSFLGDPGKPNPTPFFNLLKELKAENKFLAYVGDTAAEAILIEKLKAKYLTKSLSIIVSKNFSQSNADIILKNVNELSLIF